jgi:cytochrome P450 family 142 subfamily A polypeptide 1
MAEPEIDLTSGEFYAGNPHEAYTWMRAHDPVHWDENSGVWGIAKYDDLKEISKSPKRFSNAGGIRADAEPLPQMIDMDDPAHVRRRKLVNSGFTPQKVRESEAKIRRVCDEIIDDVCEKGECDLVRDIAAPLPMIMIGDMLGVAPADREKLLRWSDELLSALDGAPDAAERATVSFTEYVGYINEVIADRRSRGPTDDLVGTLVHASVDGDRLDDEELIFESLLILVGGDETTRHVISGGMYELLRHPEQVARLRDDPSLVTSAVEEMLRWVSPIKNMARTVTADVELRGKSLKKGQKLLLLYESANRDEDVFEEPFSFDITRHPNEHVAFGFGTHFCLGNSLARLEIRVMVERILARLPDIEYAGPADPDLRRANFIVGYESLPVRFTPAGRAAVSPVA